MTTEHGDYLQITEWLKLDPELLMQHPDFAEVSELSYSISRQLLTPKNQYLVSTERSFEDALIQASYVTTSIALHGKPSALVFSLIDRIHLSQSISTLDNIEKAIEDRGISSELAVLRHDRQMILTDLLAGILVRALVQHSVIKPEYVNVLRLDPAFYSGPFYRWGRFVVTMIRKANMEYLQEHARLAKAAARSQSSEGPEIH